MLQIERGKEGAGKEETKAVGDFQWKQTQPGSGGTCL